MHRKCYYLYLNAKLIFLLNICFGINVFVGIFIPISFFFFPFNFLQVQKTDQMSNRICHACISFLNSWQSFKNRCNAAQKKQQNLLDMVKERAKKATENTQQTDRMRQQQQKTTVDQRILKTALMQAANSTPYNNSANNNSSIDVVSNIFFFFFCIHLVLLEIV